MKEVSETNLYSLLISYLLSFQVAREAVEPHQFDSLVIGAGGEQVSRRAPCQAVDAAFVVLRSFEEHCRRRRCTRIPTNKNIKFINH